MRLIYTIEIFFFTLLVSIGAHAQDSIFHEIGTPYITNFSPKDYNSEAQNWAIVEDDRGVVYVGNGSHVLEFDGTRWRKIIVGGTGTIRSLAKGQDGIIYVGAQGDFGFLAPDSLNRLAYVSLKSKVPQEKQDFSDVWQLHAIGEDIYFTTTKYIFRWSNGLLKTWQTNSLFYPSFVLNGRFYVRQWEVGLMEMENDSLELLSQGELFINTNICAMLPHKSRFIAVTRNKGLLQYDGQEFSSFKTKADEFLKEEVVYHATMLSDSSYVIATLGAGVIRIDGVGNVLQTVNTESGLRNNKVHHVYADSHNGVWLALDNGVSRLEVPSNFSHYDHSKGLEGIVVSMVRHLGKLYAGTTAGLYVLKADDSNIQFKPVKEFAKQCWAMESVNEQLILSTNDGVYSMSGDSFYQISKTFSYSLHRSKLDSSRIYVGEFNGLSTVGLYNDKWVLEKKIEGVEEEIRSIVEDENGILWLGTRHQGVRMIDANVWGGIKGIDVYRIPENSGVADAKMLQVFLLNGKVRFATGTGVYSFNREENRYILDSRFGRDTTQWYYRAVADHNGNAWVYSDDRVKMVACNEENIENTAYHNSLFHHASSSLAEVIYPEANGVVWVGGENGVIRYDPRIARSSSSNFQTLIRSVRVGKTNIIYDGATAQIAIPEVAYDSNEVRLEYAAVSFDQPSANQFRVMLEGFDDNWSQWSYESQKDYTNLPEGDYIFKVKSKNVYGEAGTEASFQFSISTPWFRSWWAHSGYVLSLVLLVLGFVKWRSNKLEKVKLMLEETIEERTKQISLKNEQLKEMDKIKSNFFANISHEFRTPLTLILGPLNELREDKDAVIPQAEHSMMRKNAQRLLRLINQLLDLSKLEKGSLKLETSCSKLIPFVKGIAMSFETLAKYKEVSLEFDIDNSEIELYYDQDKLEKVLYNLLSNALKFTDKGGRVTIGVKEVLGLGPGAVEIIVEDNGIGIIQDRLAFVFDRFYQADNSKSRTRQGVGIGLALTKELVELHKGTIAIDSQIDKGTKVTVTLVKGKEHLLPEEIIEEQESINESIGQDEFGTIYANTSEDVDLSDEEPSDDDTPIVLVVEDNSDVRAYIRKHLVDNYDIIEAENGEEGLAMAISHVPDLIISDVMMPKMDGYELTDRLKKELQTSHIPIILLTAKASVDDKIEGLGLGADDYLIKPFDAQELIVRIDNLISLRKLLGEKYSRNITLQPKGIEVSSMDETFLKQVMNVIEHNISNPTFSVEKMSDEMSMSRVHLHRKLKALTDQSASKIIRTVRIKRAAELIVKNSATIAEIAYQVGFNNISYFDKCFKEEYHITPTEYFEENK